jgi:hypothetical protein
MKSILAPLVFGLLLGNAALAQIDEQDLPQAGQTIDMTDAGNTSVDDAQSGENQTWDFSGMGNNGVEQVTFVSVLEANFTFFLFFNNTDFALPGALPIPDQALTTIGQFLNLDIQNTYNFYARETDGLMQEGFGFVINGIGLPIIFSSSDEIIPIPLELDRQSGGSYNFEVELPSLGLWSCNATRSNLVDGRGTLLLPNATYENVYRVKSELSSDNSITIPQIPFPISFPRNETKYMFFVEGTGWPVLEITSGLLGSSAIYRTNPVDFTSVQKLDKASFSLYPNPSSSQATIQFDKAPQKSLTIDLFEISGKLVYSKTIQNPSDMLYASIPVEALDLQNGIYQVRITPDNSAPLVRALSVQR